MKVEKIDNINNVDNFFIRKVLTSSELSEIQKVQFMKNNRTQIKQTLENDAITCSEFKNLMENRPIIKFRPLKNSFTKRGDKILLAKSLGIHAENVDDYIKSVADDLKDTKKLDYLDKHTLKTIRTYIYRHGSKDDVVIFLDNELKESKNKAKTLFDTLQYGTGGLADYFVRPIHRMSNATFTKLYNVIDNNLQQAEKSGEITKESKDSTAKCALVQLYQIQQNSKFVNALKARKDLS